MSVTYLAGEGAEKAAVSDLQATQANRAARVRAPDLVPFSAISAAGQLGLGIAGLATSTSPSSAQSLEIELDNKSQLPVVTHEIKTSTSHTAHFPRPLGTDESDTLVVAKNSGFDEGGSEVNIFMLVGGVDVELGFALDGDGVWQVSANIVSQSSGKAWPSSDDGELHFYGAQVSDPEGSFSLYTASIEKSAGFISVSVLDSASS